ncbi:putative Ig domain-containing protein [Hydrogenivirga sp. 128-5-R1-1]|uniref:putative Ig domain-containing protein n=1 Tax=Hydrogenivirga sp. 128-5-R1-1 TaxID=392423 RepID=UPI000310D6E3|nr:putative Ig domain-containing protein [Hydrogenivirga sp. 128-5-R1-1]
MRREKGLTLIELAIVLIVLGILLGIGAGIIGVLIKRVKYNESKEIVNAAVEGIIGYATSNRRLPDSTQLSSAVRSTKDSYGKDLAYVYDNALTSTSTYGFCGLTSTNITVRVCPDTACSSPIQTINNVAFIIISGDGNYNNQTAGTEGVTSSKTIDVYEYGVSVDNYAGDIDRTEPYDDIVKWVSLNELQSAQGCEALTITSPSTLPAGVEDDAYTYTLRANGGRPPYTWSGSVGSGLTLSSDGTISGTINTNTSTSTGEVSGCSTQITFNATVTDSAGQSVSQSFTIPVNARPVEIITNTLPDAYEGTAYSADIDAIGGDGSYTFSGNSLPTWITLNTSTGVLSGTPPTDSGCSEGVENFSVTASSCSNTYTKGFSITVRDPDCGSGGGGSSCSPMYLSPSSGTTFNATVGNFFSQSILVSGGQPPITNTGCTPTSCRGLTLSCSNTGATISGTPTSPGTCTFNVSFQDSCSPAQSVSGSYAVNISCDPITGFASSLPSGEVCNSYSGSVSVLGGTAPYSWSITSGALPLGLSLCPANTSSTCSISGTDIYDFPNTYNFTVQVQDTCGQTSSQSFSIAVSYPSGAEGSSMQACVSGGGIRLYDNKPGRLSYRTSSSSTCVSVSNGGYMNVQLGETYTLYSGQNCNTQICVVNFCQLWDVEWQNSYSNCRVSITDNNCSFSDS